MSDQLSDTQERAGAGRRASVWRFVQHFVEMLVAMFAGMFVFGLAVGAVLGVMGLGYSHAERPAVGSVEMAFTMTAGMVLWMRIRRHRWLPILEMSGAMFAPLVLVLPLLWTEVLAAHAAMLVLHVTMVPLMLGAMLLRRQEYSAPHGRARRRAKSLKRTMLYE
jgi:hypothetical protein